jgi:hypothetical protein
MWHWDRFLSVYCGLSLSGSFLLYFVLILMLILQSKKQTGEVQRRSQSNATSDSRQSSVTVTVTVTVTFLAVQMVKVGHHCTLRLSETGGHRSSRQDSCQDPIGPLEQQGDPLLCTATLCRLGSKGVDLWSLGSSVLRNPETFFVCQFCDAAGVRLPLHLYNFVWNKPPSKPNLLLPIGL